MSKTSLAHLCPEWDYLFIEPSDPEWEACLCHMSRKEEVAESLKKAEKDYNIYAKKKRNRK